MKNETSRNFKKNNLLIDKYLEIRKKKNIIIKIDKWNKKFELFDSFYFVSNLHIFFLSYISNIKICIIVLKLEKKIEKFNNIIIKELTTYFKYKVLSLII